MNYLKITPGKTWVIDIETDDLDATCIWVVICKNIESGEVLEFYDRETFNDWLRSISGIILLGHNAVSFDCPVLNRLWDSGIDLGRVIDTLVFSYLYSPGIVGGHSLEAWGQRLKAPKSNHSDWSRLTPEMIEYCKQDVLVTEVLYKRLTERMISLGYTELSAEIEHKIRIIINEQQKNGFYFDRVGAENLRDKLRLLQSDLTREIQLLFPPTRTEVKRGTIRRRKDGSPFASFENLFRNYYDVVVNGDEYTCYELKEFNIGSPKQRVEKLLSLGWEPTKFTEKGFPKVDEETLLLDPLLSTIPGVKAIAEWLVLQGRASMIDTWLTNLGPDSRIHGRVNSCGATTRRMTHSAPNTANIPSGAKAKYGHECRSLWGVEPGRGLVLVGYDAAGLETAGLCHYLNNPKATDILLRPKPDDIHTANARRLSEALERLIDREWGAKTTWYAWLYGAGLKKLGGILKGSAKDGSVVVDTFFRNVPGLKKLIQDVQDEWENNNGRLRTIDGGSVICPSKSAALNYLVQSNGAILMKLASILLDQRAKEQGIPFKKVGDIHDEGQLETLKEYADRLGKLAVLCIEEAGRQLNLNVPVTGDYKIGDNWSSTH